MTQKETRAKRVADGLCAFCGKPRLSFKYLCDECAKVHRERQQRQVREGHTPRPRAKASPVEDSPWQTGAERKAVVEHNGKPLATLAQPSTAETVSRVLRVRTTDIGWWIGEMKKKPYPGLPNLHFDRVAKQQPDGDGWTVLTAVYRLVPGKRKKSFGLNKQPLPTASELP